MCHGNGGLVLRIEQEEHRVEEGGFRLCLCGGRCWLLLDDKEKLFVACRIELGLPGCSQVTY